jgi:methionyl-tRNA synthetase
MSEYKRYLITAALPYANGPVHIGHLAGVYIPADIYARYLRLKKKDVLYVCGSDEHGVPITLKARIEGVSPKVIVDRYHEIIKKSFADFGISFDIYSRTSSEIHHKTSSEFFKTIYDKGGFIQKTTEQYYDTEAKQFLADRYIIGICPHCGNEKAYGDQCEKCGTSLNATDLINPHSTISGTTPVLKKTNHWFLPLDKYQKFLEKWILEEHKEWKTNVYGQCKSWLDQGLQPRAVSRDLDWGVPVPIPEAKGKVLYVWFDAPIGYISATKELTDKWELYWKDKETRLIHFIGKDNIVFHCIVFPVMLKAEGSYILPDNVPANEFLNLEGDKISTSRNWAVWLHEYLEDFKDKEDVLRYVLTANMPETKDNDFTWKDFQNRNNNELVAILGNFVNRTLVLTQKYFNGKVPQPHILEKYDEDTLNEMISYKNTVEEALENFRFRDALKEAMNMARLGNKYLAETEPWKISKTNENRVKTILYVALQITTNLSIILEPFLPFTSKKLHTLLNIQKLDWEKLSEKENILPGHKISEPFLLFEKIEDAEIDKQLEKLNKTKISNQTNTNIPKQKEMITYEEFSKMDIRVATILEAEKVPKTDKLLKLTIDTGIDKRVIVSGIAEYYKPEDIIGRKICILANLQPRTLKGIESKGMILMALNTDGKLFMISPENNAENGAIIK